MIKQLTGLQSASLGPTRTRLISRKSELNSSGLAMLAEGICCSLYTTAVAAAGGLGERDVPSGHLAYMYRYQLGAAVELLINRCP